jgi:hypothetical protein
VIDATGLNPNVMYELGRVHEAGISPFIMRRVTGGSADPWPFYLRAEMTCEVADDEAGHREAIKRIQAFLARSKEGAI